MINYADAERDIKQYFKRHARLVDVVDDCSEVIRILKKLDTVTCGECSKRKFYQKGYKDGMEAGRRVKKNALPWTNCGE